MRIAGFFKKYVPMAISQVMHSSNYTDGDQHDLQLSDYLSTQVRFINGKCSFTPPARTESTRLFADFFMPAPNTVNIDVLTDTLARSTADIPVPTTTHCALPDSIAALKETDDFDKRSATVRAELEKLESSDKPITHAVSISSEDILARAMQINHSTGNRVCILNPMNGTTIGGGAFVGAGNLEEILFRCCKGFAFSLIEHAISNNRFLDASQSRSGRPEYSPNYNNDTGALYTTDVTVIRRIHISNPTLWVTHSHTNLRAHNQFKVDIVGNSSVKLDTPYDTEKHKQQITQKARAQLYTIAKNGKAKHVLLTDFGCGASNNNPAVVAKCYAEVIAEGNYHQRFEIEFTIISNNKEVFEDSLKQELSAFNIEVTTPSTTLTL